MTVSGPPHSEPFRETFVRNILIALAVGTLVTALSARTGRPVPWLVAVVVMLWPSFGGHWLDTWYLQWLHPRLPAAPLVRRIARVGVWFLGGCVLGAGMLFTARALGSMQLARWPSWWLAGAGFVGLELVAHGALQLRGKGSFYNGRG